MSTTRRQIRQLLLVGGLSRLGPISLDLAPTPLAPVALGSHHCQTRNRARLALQRIVLDLEMTACQAGKARDSKDVRDLIRTMSRNNCLWGAPRIHGDLTFILCPEL
jgi:hypothetical protein